MKRIIIPAVAALGLATAAPALAAQDQATTQVAQRDHDKNRDRDRNRNQDHKPGPQHTGTGSGQHGPIIHNDMPKPGPILHDDHPKPTTHHETIIHVTPHPVIRHETRRRYDWDKYQQGHTPPKIRNIPQLDFHVWHRNFNAPRHFHREPYHRPSGWYFRRWVFGMVLPNFFWTRDYWITDYWNYDLPDPPYGYVWVREGDDALLVNVRTGYILQVIYDLFD